MIIKFSMDQITNIDVLYTWTHVFSNEVACDVTEEYYHGDTYCKQIVADTLWKVRCLGKKAHCMGEEQLNLRLHRWIIRKQLCSIRICRMRIIR